MYSWLLDKNDPTPKGRKRDLSLREKEKQIQADLFDHIVTHGGNYTVIELVETYISLKNRCEPQHPCRVSESRRRIYGTQRCTEIVDR